MTLYIISSDAPLIVLANTSSVFQWHCFLEIKEDLCEFTLSCFTKIGSWVCFGLDYYAYLRKYAYVSCGNLFMQSSKLMKTMVDFMSVVWVFSPASRLYFGWRIKRSIFIHIAIHNHWTNIYTQAFLVKIRISPQFSIISQTSPESLPRPISPESVKQTHCLLLFIFLQSKNTEW